MTIRLSGCLSHDLRPVFDPPKQMGTLGGGASTPEVFAVELFFNNESVAAGTDLGSPFRMPWPAQLTSVAAEFASGASGATFDVNKNAASVLSTKITIDAGEQRSADAAVQPVISDDAVAEGDRFTFDCDSVGAVTTYGPCIIWLEFLRL